MKVGGYELDEIEQMTDEILANVDEELETKLIVLGLCNAIVRISAYEDMDQACIWIDRLSGREE